MISFVLDADLISLADRMIRHERDAPEAQDRRTRPRWQRHCRFGLRSLLLAVTICCILTWIAPDFLKWIFPPKPVPFWSLPRVPVVVSWRGEIPVEEVGAARRAGRIILDQDAWEKVWAILHPDEPAPEIDFDQNFAIISVNSDPNRLDVDLRIDDNGRLRVMVGSTAMGYWNPTEVSFLISVVPRKGIKTVEGLTISP